MKIETQTIYVLLLIVFFSFMGGGVYAQKVEYGNGYFVFEAEDTESDLGLWVVRKPGDPAYHEGTLAPIQDDYLEFTGNNLNGGSPKSPLTYKFTCQKTGDYRVVMRMYQPLLEHEEGDKRNDCWIRLKGDYETACVYPKDALEKDHKFWGRGVRAWGTCHSMEAHVDGTRRLAKVVYALKEGETYTFTISGRAQGCSLDYILFFEEKLDLTVNNQDLAAKNDPKYRPGLGLVDPTSISFQQNITALRKGATLKLNPLFEPSNAKTQVVWTSSDTSVVAVSEKGVLTGSGNIGEKAVITAKSQFNEVKMTQEITIVEWFPVPMESLAIEVVKDTIAEGDEITLLANVSPIDADDQSLVWTSSDTTIAKVDENGKVTALKYGVVTIKAASKAVDSIKAEAKLVILELIQPFIDLDDETKYLSLDFKDTMKVTFSYHAGTFQKVKEPIKVRLRHLKSDWSVVKDYMVTLDETVGSDSGTMTVAIPIVNAMPTDQLPSNDFYYLFLQAPFTNGNTVTKGLNPIKILKSEIQTQPIASVEVNATENFVAIGKSITLSVEVLPVNTADPTLIWSSSDAEIARVNSNGVVTGVKKGTAMIRATSKVNSTIYSEVTIEVIEEGTQVTALDELSLRAKPNVYPNPVEDILMIEVPEQGSNMQISICDINGRVVYTQRVKTPITRIDARDFQTGIYWVKVASNQGIEVQKVMIK